MNGKLAKKLRKIARTLELPETVEYAPGGPLRRRASSINPLTGEQIPGAPIPRPRVMVPSVRRAAKEAKKIYTGKPISALAPVGAPKKFADQLRGTIGKTIESQ